MNLPCQSIVQTVTIILLIAATVHAKRKRHQCPIGFSLVYPKYNGDDTLCYRLKGPESFTDKFHDCAGNLYTSKLYYKLNFNETNLVLWTDYKSLYPGGPFIDQSYTKTTGDILPSSYKVSYDSTLGLAEELCVIIDPVNNFTATRCDKKHYRYCIVEPYQDKDDIDRDGCKDFAGSWRYWSPKPSCLTAVTGSGGGAVRVNWRQAKELCDKRGGSLLSRSWRYANDPLLHTSGSLPVFPLGIKLSSNRSSIMYDTPDDSSMIPTSEWHFEGEKFPNKTTYGAQRGDFWYLVNSSYVFVDVICERPIQLKSVGMNVSVDLDGKITLTTETKVDKSDIKCLTDSATFYPSSVKVTHDDGNIYVLQPLGDGYYWCTHIDSKSHLVSESNKALYIREKQSLINFYAVKIKLTKEYNLENVDKFYSDWQDKLEEYIYFRTKYVQVFGELELNSSSTETVLKEFKATHPELNSSEKNSVYKKKVKKLYLDRKTAIIHVQLMPNMLPVPPGTWDDLSVEFMKPVYFCQDLSSTEAVPMMPLGSMTNASDCRTFKCVGDFNDGVQWLTIDTLGCTTSAPISLTNAVVFHDDVTPVMPTLPVVNDVTDRMPTEPAASTELPLRDHGSDSDSSEEFTSRRPKPTSELPQTTTPCEPEWTETVSTVNTPTTDEVVTAYPTFPPTFPPTTVPPLQPPPPPPPEEQLQQVIEDLESLLQNDTLSVQVADISSTFDQVDTLLETEEDLEIPSTLLHLLDKVGARLDLNGSSNASAVRSNLALLVADAMPSAPVRGLRIATREEEVFTDGAFEILSNEVNSTHLTSNQSEAVVQLPDSIASSNRRISFVVFRNDRAFPTTDDAINSRILSINVENLTVFEPGEYIDIHLSPMMGEPDRNMSRACAYWHFLEDGTGYWSQEGCTLYRSDDPNLLDTCRCDHLTHFAEILVPRSVFTERNENVLEVLTIIGCVLSIFGLVIIGITAALFRSWRRDYSNKIWLQLCVAIFLLVLSFLIIIFAKFDQYDIPCMLVGVLLHYATLASFCWMLVAAVLSYRRLVIVFSRDASHKLLRASAFAWGAPCAVVGILLSVAPHSYAGRFEEKTPSGAFCYPSGLALWLTIYAPIAVMLLANWTLFALIVRSVFASRRIQRHGDTNEAVRCASVSCLLVFLFGLPWIFGLFAYNVVAAYLFTLTATFQGFVLFLFFVLGNKKTRDLWLNKLKIKQTRKVPVTSSTYTNRSTGVASRAPAGAASMEAISSKPKSLSSPDNSRFS